MRVCIQREPFFEDKDADQTTWGNMEETGPRVLAYSERSMESDQSKIKAWSQRFRLGTWRLESERNLALRTCDKDIHWPRQNC